MSQEKVIDVTTIRTVDSNQARNFLGFTAAGSPVLVRADSMLIYRGEIPTDLNVSIDYDGLPLGIYALSGGAEGTFPSANFGADMLLNWRAVNNALRLQVIIGYWDHKIFVRRRHNGAWAEWVEISDSAIS